MSDPPCPSQKEILVPLDSQSPDPKSEYFDGIEQIPLRIHQYDHGLWSDDQDHLPSLCDGSEGDKIEWLVGDSVKNPKGSGTLV